MEKKIETFEIYKEKHKNLMDKVDNNLILIRENIIKIKQILKMGWVWSRILSKSCS